MGSRQTEREEEVKEEYLKTLQDLTVNSKPLIDVLTEVADENREYASTIVECIEEQINNVPGPLLKLPILYLIDSIMKHENIRQYYMHLFCRNIHKIFAKVYELSDETVRSKLAKLRLTWNGVLPVETLTTLDNMVRSIIPRQIPPQPMVHVNPNVFARRVAAAPINPSATNAMVPNNVPAVVANKAAKEELLQKQRELLELKQRKQELEQELKMLRPNQNTMRVTSSRPAATAEPATTPIDRLVAIANGLFSQVDDLRSGTYVPSDVQQVRKSAITLKNAVSKVLAQNELPSNPKLAAFAKDTTILKDLLVKFTETEKVLAETEKANQLAKTAAAAAAAGKAAPTPVVVAAAAAAAPAKRKVIIAKNHVAPSPQPTTIAVTSSPHPAAVASVATTTNTRPAAITSRNWTKVPTGSNPFVYTKPVVANGTVGVAQTPQNPPQFRIAPVSTGLINAVASRRVRDPRLRRNEQQQPAPVNQTGGGGAATVAATGTVAAAVAKEVAKTKTTTTVPVLAQQVDSKSDKRNESAETPTTEVKKSEPNPRKKKPVETKSPPKMDQPARKSKTTPEKRKELVRNERPAASPGKRKVAAKKNNAKRIHELFDDLQSDHDSKRVKSLSREERTKRLKALADKVISLDEAKRQQYIDTLTKESPRLAQLLMRHLRREKDPAKKPPAVVDAPMDITDDSGDCVIVSSPKETKPPSPEAPAEDLDASSDSKDQSIEDGSANLNCRNPSPPPHLQDVDIRPLTTPAALPAVPYPLPVVTEPVAAPAADSPSFSNPFGLDETKDIDYRQLFAFSLPIVSAGAEVESDASNDVAPVKCEATDERAAGAKEKPDAKRKHADDVRKRSKRRRTSSPSSSSSDAVSPDRRKHRYDSRNGNADAAEDVKPAALEQNEHKVRVDGVEVLPPPAPSLSEDPKLADLVVVPTSQTRASSKSPPPMFPFFGPSFTAGYAANSAVAGVFACATSEVPAANADVLKMIERDPMKMINIDGIPRQIRHYGSTAVAFLNWDDPRQISFSSFNGARRIIIDDKYCVPCSLNMPDVETRVYGKTHRFRLGAPTRELYVDGIGYECYFGGPPVKVRLDGESHYIRLDGKPPQVDIGAKRLDLVAGMINIIINDEHTFPVFLDSKPQRIDVDGVPFVLMFIDALKRILINEVPFRTEFGGLPQSFKFSNQVYYFRLTMLPVGIVPGAINIFQMVMTKLPSPPPLPPSLQFPAMNSMGDDFPMLPVPPVMPSIPSIPVNTLPVPALNCEPDPVASLENSSDVDTNAAPAVSNLLGTLNLDELFQSLVASGIVSTSSNSSSAVTTSTNTTSTSNNSSASSTGPAKPVDFRKPETLKQKQPALIATLYSGTQCGSCGMRFPEEQTLKYSEHLDWHFRLNRKGKDGARTIHSRKWYYSNNDWMKFQEMEDNSDRGQSWFDSHPATEYTEEVIEEVPCVSAGANSQEAVCELCHDRFEQFYNEDIDEWQLRNAIREDEKIYHPICYQDYKEKGDGHQSDVEEIVDLSEPIMVDDNDTSVPEDGKAEEEDSGKEADCVTIGDEKIGSPEREVPQELGLVTVKQEKLDVPKSVTEAPKSTNISADTQMPKTDAGEPEDEDSDVEEVQLIEEPIEEIIIPDDVNDLEEANLETLNAAEIIAVQQEAERSPSPEVPPVVEVVDKIVDITHSTNTVSIDGNVELGDSYQVMSGPTKIKINIAKNHTEEKAVSPKPEEEETADESSGEQPPPPGEEVAPVAAELKPKLKERKLTAYPPVTKGTEVSGLCSIM